VAGVACATNAVPLIAVLLDCTAPPDNRLVLNRSRHRRKQYHLQHSTEERASWLRHHAFARTRNVPITFDRCWFFNIIIVNFVIIFVIIFVIVVFDFDFSTISNVTPSTQAFAAL
jgi:hypothetical protein